MADIQTPTLLVSHVERNKSGRLNLLRKLKPRKMSSEELVPQPSSPPPRLSQMSTPSSLSRVQSFCAQETTISSADLLKQFTELHDIITAHVQKFYSEEVPERGMSQSIIEHASTGISLPWPQILAILGDADTRVTMLTMCIAWTVLTRSLLLKLGIGNTPGSTFLPPEIVECFQSFSLGKGAVTLGKDETNPVNFALLSRWKQTTAALCYDTYVTNSFSFFDARTVNVERALKDLDPLLSTYAKGHNSGPDRHARLDDLRQVLRDGASFAFALFGHPCFWKFDWRSDRAIAHGKAETEADPERTSDTASIGIAATRSIRLETQEIVAWPTLVRFMDEEGTPLDVHGEGNVFGEKIYIRDIPKL